MKNNFLVTPALLKKMGACENELRKFEEHFPQGCHITPETIKVVVEDLCLDVEWFLMTLGIEYNWTKAKDIDYITDLLME